MSVISDLFLGPDGKYSATKTWQHVGNTIASVIMMWLTTHGMMNEWYLAIYLGAVAGSPIANRAIQARWGSKQKDNK